MRWAAAAAALVGAAACGDTQFTNSVIAVATTVNVAAASQNQTGVVGQPLPQPISVQITDVSGNPIIGAVVTWTVLTGGGSVSAATSTTDVNGNASVIWTLGPNPGTNTLRASIATGASADISATGVAAAGGMTIVSGNNQAIGLSTASAPLIVHIANAAGNPVAGVTVTWTTTGGTLSATSTTTDASGNTQVTLTSGATAATYTVTATAGALSAVFTITAS